MPIQQYDDDLSPISTGLSRLVDWIYPRDLNTRYKLREQIRKNVRTKTYDYIRDIREAEFSRKNLPGPCSRLFLNDSSAWTPAWNSIAEFPRVRSTIVIVAR